MTLMPLYSESVGRSWDYKCAQSDRPLRPLTVHTFLSLPNGQMHSLQAAVIMRGIAGRGGEGGRSKCNSSVCLLLYFYKYVCSLPLLFLFFSLSFFFFFIPVFQSFFLSFVVSLFIYFFFLPFFLFLFCQNAKLDRIFLCMWSPSNLFT